MSTSYAIRRALLFALGRFFCPQDLNTCLCDDGVIMLDADPARILKEWEELTAAGYISAVQGYPDHRSLSPAIRRKIEAGETLLDDPFLAGPQALR